MTSHVSRRESKAHKKERAGKVVKRLRSMYPDAKCALDYSNPLELLIATILSAQCTDVRVNLVTPALFKRYRTARDFADAEPAELERMIQSTGFFRNKAKSIKGACQRIVTEFGSEVPNNMEDLLTLPGVARKTANVVLGNAFGVPGITVDTHVTRLSNRLGFTKHENAVKIESDLNLLIPPKEWTDFSHRMIYHGRQVCFARTPACSQCKLLELCPRIGVTTSK